MFRTDQAGLTLSDFQRLNSPGFIQMYGGPSAPGGYLFCDGSAISRAAYSDLFNIIGTAFGPGNGTTTFNIPDFRSRSPMGVGQGSGLSNRTLAQILGEENHVLVVTELAAHNHTQNSHNHTQDAHTHTQLTHNHDISDPGHQHNMDPHTHVQDAHTHTQDAHTHLQNSHAHATVSGATYTSGIPMIANGDLSLNAQKAPTYSRETTLDIAVNQNATAVNQNATATNQSADPTVESSLTGIEFTQNEVAANQNTTATNQSTTATNNSTGSDAGHNTVHPVLVVNFIIKF